ncbi:MAG TPA: hypothetical protein VM432_04525, partial [Bdellovibrionales bacterium]|nr:hypothetical protein [Bdellovibrionales bacterium]
RDSAFETKDLLDELGLRSFIKVTGGKGLHLHIPIEPRYPYETVKEFSHAIARLMVKKWPDKYTAVMSKQKRAGKIFVDYLRNGYGATAIAAYSLRSREEASVALPISWKELKTLDGSNVFDLEAAERFLKNRKNPWADYFDTRQHIGVLDEQGLKAVSQIETV